MKRLISIFMICLLTIGLFTALPVSAAAGLSVTASSTVVTVGQNVTVTVKYDGDSQPIAGVIGNLTYDTNTFTYVSFSGNDVQVNGGAGKMRFIYSPSTAQAPTSLAVTFTFKSDAPGACNFSVTTEEFINDNDYSSLGSPAGSVTVTANNPTLSGNADLKSLVPSKGTLTPKFDPNKTEYTISVSNTVTSLTLSAVPDHSGAKTSISGKNALEVGKNTRVITVTAPNGTTKKYTVVITRAAAPTTSGTTAPSGTTPTVPTTPTTPPENKLEVRVGDKTLTILDTQASVDLPNGFGWGNVTIRNLEIPAAIHSETGMILLYLTGTDRADNGFYIYDKDSDLFTRFRPLNTDTSNYLIYDLPANSIAPAGTAEGKLVYTNHYVAAYVYEDAALSDFYIVWAAPMGGTAGWYSYDKAENTLQRYYATPGNGGEGILLPSNSSQNPSRTTATKASAIADASTDSTGFSLGSLLKNPNSLLIVCGIGLLVVALIVISVLLIISSGRRKNGKH